LPLSSMCRSTATNKDLGTLAINVCEQGLVGPAVMPKWEPVKLGLLAKPTCKRTRFDGPTV
ncbi:hypothetical protein V6N11_029760, partial [Hibiscus sabdariffa]